MRLRLIQIKSYMTCRLTRTSQFCDVHEICRHHETETDSDQELHDLQTDKDKLSNSYAALERKAALYDRLSAGRFDVDEEKYNVDFLQKGFLPVEHDRRRPSHDSALPIYTSAMALEASGTLHASLCAGAEVYGTHDNCMETALHRLAQLYVACAASYEHLGFSILHFCFSGL